MLLGGAEANMLSILMCTVLWRRSLVMSRMIQAQLFGASVDEVAEDLQTYNIQIYSDTVIYIIPTHQTMALDSC